MAKFRNDINLLRAIAVVSVLLFHLRISLFSGGFVGVDIFFVISGYLMTKIILAGFQNNSFSVLDFYIKRFKRIVPALLVLVLAVTIAGFFIYLPIQYKENENNAFSSLLFFSNIFYWKHSGYFDSAANNNVFLHTWSLSVEWQFYLIYPLVIALFLRFSCNKKILATIFIAALLAFTFLSIWTTYRAPVASFFLLPTRTWELMIGGLAFMLSDKIKSNVLLILSYIAIVLSVIFLNEGMLWPGWFTIIPVVATFLIIVINHDDNFLCRNKTVQLIGKTSYSIYLWHWPIIVFAGYLGYDLGFGTDLFVICSSTVIAYLSFKYIESLKWQKTYCLVGITACLSALTFVLANKDVNSWLFKRKTLEIAAYADTHQDAIHRQFSQNYCFILEPDSKLGDLIQRTCLTIDTTRQNVLLIGDSHAACMSGSFREAFEQRNINLVTAAAIQGFPLISEFKNAEFPIKLYRYIYFDYLVKNRKYVNKVILAGDWFTGSTEVVAELLKTVDYLKKLNIPVVIIGQNNVFTIPFPSVVAKWSESNVDNVNLYTNKKAGYYNQLYKAQLKPYYIDVYYSSNIPKLSNNNEPFILDNDHFSKFGADLVVKNIFNNAIFRKQILNDL